jgi:hypothetical protein
MNPLKRREVSKAHQSMEHVTHHGILHHFGVEPMAMITVFLYDMKV